MSTSQQIRRCCRCEKAEVKFICVGDIIDAPTEDDEPQHEGSIH
jgi:hypothetical protein